MTAILDPKELAVKHYLDSWRVAQFLPMFGHTVLDIGTGAGFPGIPIAITEPMARVTVLDSTRKKTDFVQTSVDALGLKNVEVHWGHGREGDPSLSRSQLSGRSVASPCGCGSSRPWRSLS
jgi:16S rRNA (guanine527-N7)-methyltransferase